MKLKTALAGSAAALLSHLALASTIDATLETCLNRDPSTAGMIQCLAAAETSWDQELNGAYRSLRGSMPADVAEDLRTAQRAWLNFRDKDFAFSGEFYVRMEGTMWRPVAVSHRVDTVRDRVVDLLNYEEAGHEEVSVQRKQFPEHRIDQELTACVNRNDTTIGMRKCLAEAAEAWDAELNAVYRSLSNALSADLVPSLVAAERAWADYKTAETELAINHFATQGGSIQYLNSGSRMVNLIKTRYHQLNSFLAAMNE